MSRLAQALALLDRLPFKTVGGHASDFTNQATRNAIEEASQLLREELEASDAEGMFSADGMSEWNRRQETDPINIRTYTYNDHFVNPGKTIGETTTAREWKASNGPQSPGEAS